MLRYWPAGTNWRLWKAQLYQESRLDPSAVSPVGAAGLAQFMPATWADVCRRLGFNGASPHETRYAILAGAYYMRTLHDGWSSRRPVKDRWQLAQASYNAGMGSILKAQRLCGNPSLYPDIIRCLPSVTGHYSRETITYVERIERWHKEMSR